MKLVDAIEIVIELAKQNVLEDPPPDLEDEAKKQQEACDTVEDFFVNHWEDLEEKLVEIGLPEDLI